eukprot:NODE_145_length_15762_cov_0.655238.p7 type:complete len:130 gc:universal NODE_145_length_15762_cov_0.655238:2732-2343(-)
MFTTIRLRLQKIKFFKRNNRVGTKSHKPEKKTNLWSKLKDSMSIYSLANTNGDWKTYPLVYLGSADIETIMSSDAIVKYVNIQAETEVIITKIIFDKFLLFVIYFALLQIQMLLPSKKANQLIKIYTYY